MATIRLRYVVSDVDRHGNVRHYFRNKREKIKIRLRGLPGSDEFMAAYKLALEARTKPKKLQNPAQRWPKASMGELVGKFLTSSIFRADIDERSQRVRRNILSKFIERRENGLTLGELPYKGLETRHIKKFRNQLRDKPGSATNLLKALRHLFKYAVEEDLIAFNPARDVEYLSKGGDGFHTWTREEVKQYEAYWPIGTKQRLAMALLLYTGQRRSDVVCLGRQHEHKGMLHYRQKKTGKEMMTPILPELRTIINASRTGNLTYLINQYGRPYSNNGFGNQFGSWCEKAGLPHCSAHGLRKSGATIAAENGATEAQLKAIFGWDTLQQASRYTRKVNQGRIAKDSQKLLLDQDNDNDAGPTFGQEGN